MSSLTNINNNSSVVNVGRTTPVTPGQQPAEKSIPVVIASDQEPVPVVEQNKILSEVALSLLGIPRSEVALGIFADVNTYDVNPTEWSSEPVEYTVNSSDDGWGVKHLPEEAGALIEAPKDKTAVLTSKRFFRYQPGRVSAATFGVKSTVSPSAAGNVYNLNPSIRKYGIFDKYDGYYWETRADGKDDNFCVVRRTQSLLRNNPLSFGNAAGQQIEDHALSGKAPNVYTKEPNAAPSATKFLIDNRFKLIETAFAAAEAADANVLNLSAANKVKCKRDMDLAMEAYILDLQYGGNAHSIVNATTYKIALLNNTTAETSVHTQLRSAIVTALNGIGETASAGRIYTSGATSELARWTLNAVAGTQPTQGEINGASYGTRSGISTVFAIYSKFLAYIGSEYTFDSTTPTPNIVAAGTYATAANTLSAEEIKYRCYRDISYILKGYAEDLEFGGNASTIYNAKRYYFNGIQVYSQTPGGALGEIKRHQFIQKLLTESGGAFLIPTVGGKSYLSLTSLFPNVFSSTARTKLITLSNLIINNFNTEYVGDIVYGSGSNYGDLVVLRDGLVMTHAAVYDPSLLKETKNVVVKPTVVAKTTSGATLGVSGTSTISLASNTGVVAGQSINASVPGIPDGASVVSVTGTTVTISTNLTASIPNGSNIVFGDSTLESSQEEFVVGQYINFYGTAAGANSHGLTANKLYKVEKVRGAKGNVITVSDATTKNDLTVTIVGTALTIDVDGNPDNVVLAPGTRLEGKGLADGTTIVSGAGLNWVINTAPSVNLTSVKVTKIAIIKTDPNPSNPTFIYINPNTPFIFPKEYFTGVGTDPERYKRPDGMFPLMYSFNGVLPATTYSDFEKVGYIDTSVVSADPATIRAQIDTVNLMYNNWVKQNVDPRYYSVYEYRVPRSRFSTDQLNGETNFTVYSDVATGVTGRVYPGQTVVENNTALQTVSVWDIDFTKVTMLKVEFSWYGAVGALFLAYVPVSNGQARWVRVHHLRASNQLKISSLGNATLPITYLVFGGGSTTRLGIEDTSNKGYTRSNHIVKYGASYYIDGGDRGTVRLYSHSTMNNIDVYGSRYALGNIAVQSDSIGAYIDVTGVSGLPTDKRFFMKAKILTNSRSDQNVEVIWVSGNKLYINKGALNSATGLVAIANRPSVVFGLKAKENILNSVGKGVRNRVQVYPTKMSTSSIAPVGVTDSPKIKLQLLKTPLYQPDITPTGSFTLTTTYDITPSNLVMPTASTGYLAKDGDGIYGWFRANVGTVFGYLYRLGGNYYFNLLETYSEQVTLLSGINFLAEGRFDFSGATLSSVSEDTIQKERLSSVFVSTQIQCPIPKTGIEVASFFLKEGSDMFDLLSYFDYNKDYLSFPLTDKVESIYLAASSIQSSTGNPIAEISSSLTWEEQ